MPRTITAEDVELAKYFEGIEELLANSPTLQDRVGRTDVDGTKNHIYFFDVPNPQDQRPFAIINANRIIAECLGIADHQALILQGQYSVYLCDNAKIGNSNQIPNRDNDKDVIVDFCNFVGGVAKDCREPPSDYTAGESLGISNIEWLILPTRSPRAHRASEDFMEAAFLLQFGYR